MIIGAGLVGLSYKKKKTSTVVFSDNFNRADSTAVPGALWTPMDVGTWGISNNALYNSTYGNAQCVIANPGIKDFEVSTRVVGQTNAATNIMNLVPRFLDLSNYLFARVFANNLELYKITAGSLAKVANVPATLADGEYHYLMARCVGTTVKLYFNGALLITYTLIGADATTFPNYTKVGYRLSRSGVVTIQAYADNIEVVSV